MKVRYIFIICLMCCFFSGPLSCFAGSVITGTIIEQSKNREFIQVKDSIYRVSNVWRDNGVDDPVSVTRDHLQLGSVVQIYQAEKTVDYYRTEQIVLLLGLKKQQALAILAAD